jgi:hypothetical protein
MFPRVAQATFKGLLQWPDLLVFGLLSFALSLGLNAVFEPFWLDYASRASSDEGNVSVVLALLGLFAQQFILTACSIAIAVAAARVILARLSGGTRSVFEALRLAPFLRPILTYSLLFAVVTTVVLFAYLIFLLGEDALAYGRNLTTTGATGLTQVPTTVNPGAAGLLLLIFFPLLGVWTFANFLVPPVIAAEQAGGWRAIVRSGSLVRRSLSVVVGLILTVFAFSCVLALVLSFLMVLSMDAITLQQMSETPTMTLPDLPLVMQAGLTALVFIVGAIFTTAWYMVAAEDEALQ